MMTLCPRMDLRRAAPSVRCRTEAAGGERLFRGTGRGFPSRSVGLFPEVCTGNEGLVQILWVLNDAGDDQPGIAIRLLRAGVILGENRVRTIRHAIFA